MRTVRPDDVVVVHDPQPAGLVPALVERGARVVWRCHVGIDRSNEWTEQAWDFLRPYVATAHAHVFSRAAFAPSFIAPERRRSGFHEYRSDNTERMSEEDLARLLESGDWAPGLKAHVAAR